MHLHQKALRKGGADKLSEAERVSLAQLCDGLSAADQLLFQRLAEAQLYGPGAAAVAVEARAPSSSPTLPRQRSSFDAEMAAAEREMKLSAEQRAVSHAAPMPEIASRSHRDRIEIASRSRRDRVGHTLSHVWLLWHRPLPS